MDVLSEVPELHSLRDELKALREELSVYRTWVPPGHYYSPIPDLAQLRAEQARLLEQPRALAGIELNEQAQLRRLDAFRVFHADLAFPRHRSPSHRYYYENEYFPYSDAIFLFCLIRQLRPQRIVEIGSGHSSAVILDTNERFFDGGIDCTFIDPEPKRLHSLIRERDTRAVRVIPERAQYVDPDFFTSLQPNDILFVDSTHVSKIGSDVNHIVFGILPRLASGVYIHFHDIGYPFEYPMHWVYEGRAWNEAYILRAFLQYNSSFEIVLFQAFLRTFCSREVAERLPAYRDAGAGGSLWLRRS